MGWRRGGSFQDLGDLDVRIGHGRAVCQRWDGVVCLVLEECEHVGCGLAQVVVSRDFGKGDGVRKPIDGEGVSDAMGAGDVAFVAAVVVS